MSTHPALSHGPIERVDRPGFKRTPPHIDLMSPCDAGEPGSWCANIYGPAREDVAALFQAAPDLLEALERLARAGGSQTEEAAEAHAHALAVIAKARGE